jgi:hypothetical protein
VTRTPQLQVLAAYYPPWASCSPLGFWFLSRWVCSGFWAARVRARRSTSRRTRRLRSPRRLRPAPNDPAGPYGTAKGATIANLSFIGWHDPAASGYTRANFETVRLSDFYNPAKAPEAPRVLVINASAVWCSVCRAEYTHLSRDQIYVNYRPKGIEILGVLFEDNDGFPARPQDLELWGGANGFQVPFPLVLDPGFKSGIYFASDATPLNMIIDTSTMKILDITMGFDARTPQDYWASIEQWISK